MSKIIGSQPMAVFKTVILGDKTMKHTPCDCRIILYDTVLCKEVREIQYCNRHASAPELLEALKSIESNFGDENSRGVMIRKVIAKAEGR